MVSTTTTTQQAVKPNLEELKRKTAAALGFDVVQQQQESEEGVQSSTATSNGVALNGFTPTPTATAPEVAEYAQNGENFVGIPPVQVIPNTAFPSLPPPEVARTIPCRFWPSCRYGDECAFAHDPALAASNGVNVGASIPALPTPRDSPTTSSPAQMMPMSPQAQHQGHPAMMGGFYYPYPTESMPIQQDYYAPQPFPMHHHQPYYHGYPQFQSPPQQQAPLHDPRFANYGYPAYPAQIPTQPQSERPASSPPMHSGIPTAPRAQQQQQLQLQQAHQARSQTSPTSRGDETAQTSSVPQQNQTEGQEVTSPSSATEAASMHTFFSTNAAHYNPEAVMAASGLPINRAQYDPQRSSLSSSSNRRASSLPGSSFVYSPSARGNTNPIAAFAKPKFNQPRSAMPCSFFNDSKCRNGDLCQFAHTMMDGSDAKALGKNIVGPDGNEGDSIAIENFRKSEGARREKMFGFQEKTAVRSRNETFPSYREGRFNPRDQVRGKFVNGTQDGVEQVGPVSLEGRQTTSSASRASSNQRVPNGADFPALPAPTTPVFEKAAEFPSSASSEKAEASSSVSTMTEQVSEAAQPIQETPEDKSAPAAPAKLSFSFASAAARGANVPPPVQQKKINRPAQVNHNHHRSDNNTAPMPVAVA